MLGAIIGDIVGSIYEWRMHMNKVYEFLKKAGTDYLAPDENGQPRVRRRFLPSAMRRK